MPADDGGRKGGPTKISWDIWPRKNNGGHLAFEPRAAPQKKVIYKQHLGEKHPLPPASHLPYLFLFGESGKFQPETILKLVGRRLLIRFVNVYFPQG